MQPVPFQSRQQASQFMYVRNVSINGSNRYFTEAPTDPITPVASGVSNAKVWNETFDPKNTVNINGVAYLKPLGGGGLSLFCVSIDHPAIKFVKVGTGSTEPSLTNLPGVSTYFNSKDLNNPNVNNLASNASFRYPQFYHASTVSGAPSNGAPAQQARYFQFSNTGNWPYPMKQAFYQNDRYLIGTSTVGSYMFVESPSMETIKVKGTGLDSFAELDFGSENQIIVPIVLQYRMADYLENIGGAPNSLITNLTYTRGLGLDVSIKGEPTFSFDFIASAHYTAETVTQYTTTTLTSSAT